MRKKGVLWLLLLVFGIGLIAGCAGGGEKTTPPPVEPKKPEKPTTPPPSTGEEPSQPTKTETPPPAAEGAVPAIVSVDWLKENLDSVIPLHVSDKQQVYNTMHIPGARFLDQRKLYAGGFKPDGPGTILSKADFEALMSELGITPEDHVVVYGNPRSPFVARAYWVLKAYGHEKVSYLDGGLDAWLAKKYPTTSEVPQITKTTYTAKEIDESLWANAEYVKGKLGDSGVVIVDARSPAEYNAGHIPGAVNLNWITTNLNKDGTFKSAEELKKLYESKGVTPDKEIITYCVTGTRSSNTFLVLKEILGYPNVKNYDGSWNEWKVKYPDNIEK